MSEERTTDERTTDARTDEEAWREVGKQFQALGESLATAFRTAWESEENRQHLESAKKGLESMIDDLGQAIREASATPEAKTVREEAERAAESARTAGEKAWRDAQPHLVSALSQVNAEIQKVIKRLEQGKTASVDSGAGSMSPEPDAG